MNSIEDGIKPVNRLYLHCGFKITRIHADGELKTIHMEVADLGIALNFLSKKEHVPKIERFNWNVKERVQYTLESMPSTWISKLMIVHIVATEIFFWMYFFHPNLSQECLTPRVQDNSSLGLLCTIKSFSALRQVNMFRYINMMNPGTLLINIGKLEKSF